MNRAVGRQPPPEASAKAAPIKLAFSTWNGYIGIVIGVKEGFFEDAGVDVEYTVVEDPVQRFNAFKAGSLDAIATTVDTFSRTNANGVASVMVLGLDASVGGDGIVAKKDITSVEQLKGQTVAVSAGLDEPVVPCLRARPARPVARRRQADRPDVRRRGAAFVAGSVPVAVTWEPWLSKAEENPDGHVVVSTKKYRTIITDQVAFSSGLHQGEPRFGPGLHQGLRDGGRLPEVEPGRGARGRHGLSRAERPTSQGDDGDGADLVDRGEQEVLRDSDSPGPIYDIFTKSAEFWKELGEIKTSRIRPRRSIRRSSRTSRVEHRRAPRRQGARPRRSSRGRAPGGAQASWPAT